MKNNLCNYDVKNIFISKTQDEVKQMINLKIRNLCVMEVEKIYSFDYNIDIHILGDTSETEKGEVS
ncbi:MAG: hypothetical protein IKD04_03900 [Clostridia bacterium]|nr:hypothetical protein [Clostridia bacterium]